MMEAIQGSHFLGKLPAGSKTDGKMCGGCTSEQRWRLTIVPHPVQLLQAVLCAEVLAS